MSEFFLNERSLHGQYEGLDNFLKALRVVMTARRFIERDGFRLYCDARIRLRPVIGDTVFEQAVRTSGNKELISGVLAWLSKAGPFWAAEQHHSPDDLFGCHDDDVTDSALAEAASRHSADTPCHLLCFVSPRWNYTPVVVAWTRTYGEVDVPLDNFWELPPLEQCLKATAPPLEDWPALLVWALRACTNLLLSKDVIAPILREPFSHAAACDIQMLLRILNEISACHDAEGALNSRGLELLGKFFQGHHARFTDEAPSADFQFIHPLRKEKVLCSWHGKVRLGRQYRIHFEWPKPRGALLWVSYIGQKLTKW